MKITNSEHNILKILSVNSGSIVPSHVNCTSRHSDCFVYVKSGFAEYIFSDKKIIAKKGDIIFLSFKSKYKINVTDNNYTFIFVDFFFKNNHNCVFDNEIYSSKSVDLLKNDFEKLYTLWNKGNFSDKIYCKSIIYKIYSEIARLEFTEYVSIDRRQQIEKAVQYIYDNLCDASLDIGTLSNLCNISEVHFRRIFYKIYHTTPIKFITKAKLNKSYELLRNTNIPISQIAENCGFTSQYYFSKIFKTENKQTPSEYRKNNNNRL